MLMSQYRCSMPMTLSAPVTVMSSSVKPRLMQLQYQIEQETFELMPKKCQPTTVNAEYARYILRECNPGNCDILHFWEVCRFITE